MLAGFDAKQKLVAFSAMLVILGSAAWIYKNQKLSSGCNVPLQQAVGQVLAEQTMRLVGPTGTVVIVTVAGERAPELKFQIEAFEKQLKASSHISIKDTVALDPGDNPKYRPGAGLSAKHFLKIARKHQGVDAIVSFVGAPPLSEQDLAQMKTTPKFIAETHSPEKLVSLFDKKILLAAVVPRFDFPAPGPRNPKSGREWFENTFQVLSPGAKLPDGDPTRE